MHLTRSKTWEWSNPGFPTLISLYKLTQFTVIDGDKEKWGLWFFANWPELQKLRWIFYVLAILQESKIWLTTDKGGWPSFLCHIFGSLMLAMKTWERKEVVEG